MYTKDFQPCWHVVGPVNVHPSLPLAWTVAPTSLLLSCTPGCLLPPTKEISDSQARDRRGLSFRAGFCRLFLQQWGLGVNWLRPLWTGSRGLPLPQQEWTGIYGATCPALRSRDSNTSLVRLFNVQKDFSHLGRFPYRFLEVVTPLGRRVFYRSLSTWLKACRAEKLKTKVLGAPANYRSIQNEDKVSVELQVSGKCDLIQKKSDLRATFLEHTNCLNGVPPACPSRT